ncbi:MAG: hypothetical protein KHY46_02800 [Clostridiales bacterium]|nr:hypothetical protein [Clostridiales bacterium]
MTMKKEANLLMWGVILSTFSLNLFRIPILPKAVGLLIWYVGTCKLCRTEEAGSTEEKWRRTAELSALLLFFLAAVQTLCALTGLSSRFPETLMEQMAALSFLLELCCGLSILTILGGRSFYLYALLLLIAVAAYEYSLVLSSSAWNTTAALFSIFSRLVLIVRLANRAA